MIGEAGPEDQPRTTPESTTDQGVVQLGFYPTFVPAAELRSYRGIGGGNQVRAVYFDPANPSNRAERRAAARLRRDGRR